MVQQDTHLDELVTLTTRPTEFEAQALVAALEDDGIEAVAFSRMRSVLPLGDRHLDVPVQVRRRDLERARDALKKHQDDSVDLNWEQVNVGERVDDLPLTSRDGMPLIPKLGFIAATLIIIMMLIAVILTTTRII